MTANGINYAKPQPAPDMARTPGLGKVHFARRRDAWMGNDTDTEL